jgi:anti-anti-sigma factor
VTVPAFTVDSTRLEAAEVLTLVGEADAYLLHRLQDELARLLDRPRPLVVSFERTTFVDSTILSALIGAARDGEERGKRILFYLPRGAAYEVHRVFATTGLDSILPVHDSWDSIVAAMGATPAARAS